MVRAMIALKVNVVLRVQYQKVAGLQGVKHFGLTILIRKKALVDISFGYSGPQRDH